MKINKEILISAALGIFCILAVLFWARAPHRPVQAVQTARQFIDDLAEGNLNNAYERTTSSAMVGSDFNQFKINVEREWNGHIGTENNLDVQLHKIFPFQSNGNRIRRRLTGRPIEMPEVSIDFLIKNDGEDERGVPFEVRVKYLDGQNWRVSAFQAHAL